MTPEQLITFAAIAEHANISRAARALHLSQPSVSGQLRLLQEEFGEPLYRRDGRGIRLTPTGAQLATYAARLRDTWLDIRAYREALRGLDRGTLRIGATTTPTSYLLPSLIADFQRRYPGITVQTASGNTAEMIAAPGEFDIVIIEGPVDAMLPDDVAVHAWYEDEIVAIVSPLHRLAPASTGTSRVTFATLEGCPLVLRETAAGMRKSVERAFAHAGVSMNVALEIAGVEGVKEAVRAGVGVGFVSEMSMRHEDGSLCVLKLGPEPFVRRFSILVPHAEAISQAAQRFLDLCMEDRSSPA